MFKSRNMHSENSNTSSEKPFLILLEWDDAKNPYFALWVDNAELLVPL